MEYIIEQVESCTLGVSSKMIANEEFHHLNHKKGNNSIKLNNDSTTKKGNGEPLLIPNNALFTSEVLEISISRTDTVTR